MAICINFKKFQISFFTHTKFSLLQSIFLDPQIIEESYLSSLLSDCCQIFVKEFVKLFWSPDNKCCLKNIFNLRSLKASVTICIKTCVKYWPSTAGQNRRKPNNASSNKNLNCQKYFYDKEKSFIPLMNHLHCQN